MLNQLLFIIQINSRHDLSQFICFRMKSSPLICAILVVLSVQMLFSHKSHQLQNNQDLLQPQTLRPYMFMNQISGEVNILTPSKVHKTQKGKIASEQYVVEMVKIKQQILPKKLCGPTTLYVYAGKTSKGYYAGFPGPAIVANKDRPIKVTWKNQITGPHILPVDYKFPFINDTAFRDEVPTVPHAHGLVSASNSDGGPQAYWTKSGQQGMSFWTYEKKSPNSAVYIYPNQQQAGNFWIHDHAYGITRLNVYAGLVSLYKIVDKDSIKEKKVYARYGVSEAETKYMIVTDKSFKTNGELYYPEETPNENFEAWVPEFFGNTMLVNGVLWPKMNLKQGKHRIVFLNGCQSRFLNIWFDNNGVKIPFELIRADGAFYSKPVTVTELLAAISTRYEIILDLSQVNGEVIMKNNANGPYPNGGQQNLNEQFTGQIMKIFVQSRSKWLQNNIYEHKMSKYTEKNYLMDQSKPYDFKEPYPRFSEGQKVFMTLFEVQNEAEYVDAAFINGISMMTLMMEERMPCMNTTYKVGKTYDFYFINLTPDAHPIHFHLINLQKVKQFKFNVEEYEKKYFEINNGEPDIRGWTRAPIDLDPEEFRTGADEYPIADEKVFRDTVNVFPEYVTVLRVNFAKNDGTLTKSFDMKGQMYVLHCHILEHEDNSMMINYCLE